MALTSDQINVLRDSAYVLAQPVTEFILEDVARRVAKAGKITDTAAYQIYRAQALGESRKAIKDMLRKQLGITHSEINRLFRDAAKRSYSFDTRGIPWAQPFEQNGSLQQIVSAAVALAKNDFTNLTQTLGLTAPDGKPYPLQKAYQKCMDFAFERVFTGASDYSAAIRRATHELADKGVRFIDYESGVSTSLEAAVRRNIMGGLGLMDEQIVQADHDMLGCNGWEISAHANSAPDHEDIQGRQYSDADFARLNASLARRIGTLNCGHTVFPIILGVHSPQYTPEQLRRFREENARGITYQGRHYTGYEATQKQRALETAIRAQKRRCLVQDAAGDEDKLLLSRVKLGRLREEYARFSNAAGLPVQNERAQVAGFGHSQASKAVWANRKFTANAKDGIINSRGDGVGIDIEIDRFTPCLLDTKTGKLVETTYSLASPDELKSLKNKGWLFNWRGKDLKDSDIYKLTLKDDSEIQGLVAIRDIPSNHAVYLQLTESAPENRIGRRYEGVGGHLFAIAAKKSLDAGYGGYVYFEAKNERLVNHYSKAFGALLYGMPHPYSMALEEDAARALLDLYTLYEGD